MCSSKIIATIGPSCDSENKIKQLFNKGMRIARLNFSHGNHEYFENVIKIIRSISDEIAIIIDTKGPEIRTSFSSENITYKTNSKITLSNNGENSPIHINIDYENISKLKKNDCVLIDDGYLELKILERKKSKLLAKVVSGHTLGSRKSVLIRNYYLNVPYLSSQDKKDLNFAIKHSLDFVAASFIRTPQDVVTLKNFLKRKKSSMKIISKIEHSKAVNSIDKIIEMSNAIMIARGDLGVDIEAKKVPYVQKKIINQCNKVGKPVIVATQMLESMRISSKPTRAEVSDVTQAILEGVDAVMLSGETASGKYPLLSFSTMKDIIEEYSKDVDATIIYDQSRKEKDISINIGRAAANLGRIIRVNAIITPTLSGFSARNVARFKPSIPIYAPTHKKTILRELQLSRGVYPLFIEKKENIEDLTYHFIHKCFGKKLLRKTDTIIITSGKLQLSGRTNMLEIHKVKEII